MMLMVLGSGCGATLLEAQEKNTGGRNLLSLDSFPVFTGHSEVGTARQFLTFH